MMQGVTEVVQLRQRRHFRLDIHGVCYLGNVLFGVQVLSNLSESSVPTYHTKAGPRNTGHNSRATGFIGSDRIPVLSDIRQYCTCIRQQYPRILGVFRQIRDRMHRTKTMNLQCRMHPRAKVVLYAYMLYLRQL